MNLKRAQFTGLVVEDEWLLRMELADEFGAAGWKILEAETGEAALALIEDGARLDFLITDIRLPGAVDGWTIAERFRARWPGGAVIYVSANSDLPARRMPDSRFISKPCEMGLLLETCDALVLP